MRGYPVNIEMLSRFRTAKESAAIMRRLKRGEIDLVVGTHKLLGKDVEFKNLGLLIVDEEQRFGVAQKEKIKMRSADIDVLTLTATPIPRSGSLTMQERPETPPFLPLPPTRRPPIPLFFAPRLCILTRQRPRTLVTFS